MCLISESRCGLDLQEVKASCDVDQIAARRFTAGEQHYVSLWGEEGFFDLWVRKEAFCKCTGQGIFTKMPEMVDSEMELLPQVIWQDKTYYFQEIQISPEIKCAVCTEGPVSYTHLTGISTGPHLHFEVRIYIVTVDPNFKVKMRSGRNTCIPRVGYHLTPAYLLTHTDRNAIVMTI